MLFMNKTILRVKRTGLMRGSWLTGSDRTVQSESENYGCEEEREGSFVSIFPPADFKILRMLAS